MKAVNIDEVGPRVIVANGEQTDVHQCINDVAKIGSLPDVPGGQDICGHAPVIADEQRLHPTAKFLSSDMPSRLTAVAGNFTGDFVDGIADKCVCRTRVCRVLFGTLVQQFVLGRFVSHFDKLGLKNAALYLFDEGVVFEKDNDDLFPEYINLRCVTKSGELYVLPPDRQKCLLREMFERVELPQVSGFVTFPIFNKWNIYGFLVCELTPHIATEGEFLADQLGRLICTSQGGRAI